MNFPRFVPLAASAFFASMPLIRATDVLTYHNDNGRTGQNLAETILTTSNVRSSTFGLLFTLPVDGKVDAQPLVVSGVTIPGQGGHNVLIVPTENDSMYAFDADSGAQLWHATLTLSGETPSDDRGCSQVSPQIGVTSTPVIDRTAGPNGAIFTVAMSKDGSGNYYQRLHALDLTTGAELFGGPMTVVAKYPGTGANNDGNGNVVFDPKQYKERAALLLLNGIVYISFASHCDASPYTAWVMGYTEQTLRQVTVLDMTPNGQMTSIWQSGGGLNADSSGNIYFLLANGTFDTNLNAAGFPSKGDYGNAFMKLSTAGNLAVADYFATYNTVAQSNADTDFGSGGSILLPDLLDSHGTTRHLAVGAGKDSNIYVVDRDNMGKFNSNNNNQIYQQVSGAISGGVWSVPAFFNGTLYYGSVGDNLKAFPFTNGVFPSTAQSKSSTAFAYPGATPSISANGTSNAIVWATENTSPAVLHAYDAANLANELYNSNQAANGRDNFGVGNKYITPTIVNGKVYVGTTNGVGVFGLLAGSTTPVITSQNTATASLGSPFSYQITATNGPTSFTAAPLPAGLSFNTSSGVIAGTPTMAGMTTVALGAANGGGTGTGSVQITVTDPCIATLSPMTRQFANSGGSANVTVTIDSGCNWSATTDSPTWISFDNGSGTSGGSFTVVVTANSGVARMGTVTVGSQSFKVMEGGLTVQFNDVPITESYFDYISLLYDNGITAGCQTSPPEYCPDTAVTREQMAVFLVAALDLATKSPLMFTPSASFEDVLSSSVYFDFVQHIDDLGITAGCSTNPPNFCPNSNITQGQMAVFVIVSWMMANNLSTFTYSTTPYFTDVQPSDPFFKFVQKMRDMGFWNGCSASQYCETANVTRAQMAPMVLRSLLGAP